MRLFQRERAKAACDLLTRQWQRVGHRTKGSALCPVPQQPRAAEGQSTLCPFFPGLQTHGWELPGSLVLAVHQGLNGFLCQPQIDAFRAENFTPRPVKHVLLFAQLQRLIP